MIPLGGGAPNRFYSSCKVLRRTERLICISLSNLELAGWPIGHCIWAHSSHRDYLDADLDHSDPEGGSHDGGQQDGSNSERRGTKGLCDSELAKLIHFAE